jgi:hypothetical protein
MDRLSSLAIRLSLVWLLLGAAVGGLMLTDRAAPGTWRLWAAPTHGHVLFVGWFLQFAIGVAYWLLPRRRSATRPLGYQERPGLVAIAALNLGLLLRVVAEPVERSGHATDWTLVILAGSAVLQLTAATTFVAQLWPRLGDRDHLRRRPNHRRQSDWLRNGHWRRVSLRRLSRRPAAPGERRGRGRCPRPSGGGPPR